MFNLSKLTRTRFGNLALSLFSVSAFGLCLSSCEQLTDEIEKIHEPITLKASSIEIVLNDEDIKKDVVTFSWTQTDPSTKDHPVSYTTKLDLAGNNFGPSTAISNQEDEGIISRSFTSEQLQNWAKLKWGIPNNRSFTVQFRVIAQWEEDSGAEAEEVRTVTVDVQPATPLAIEADKIFLGGTAVTGTSRIEMSRTLEDDNQYAALVDLQAGDLQIPIELKGATHYIYETNSTGALQDGEEVRIKKRNTAFSWQITTPGQYRIVVNLQAATSIIYSPAKALLPKSVVWNNSSGVATTTEVTDLWMHGAINGFGTPIKMDCSVSLADPQILIYRGGRTGKTKFIVYGGSDNNKNIAYAFSCPLTATGTAQEMILNLGTEADLSGGFSSAQRNSYYTIPSGTNFLVLDLRKMKILADQR
ncbi:SusE domain-containing protein [Desertivirga arenae]|uniref:SusE domain-containing protein n=1 Tax=Desertivirga arenae TaxID=2810309 RepID=UPI001A9757B0|nr:SusE domain-containing protein [Pedobacter sp. SYSU D00823]